MVLWMTDKFKSSAPQDCPAIVVVAGEPSGDWIGANVVRALNNSHNDIHWFGVGGDELQSAGVDLVQHICRLTALGPLESLKKGPGWMNAWATLRLRCKKEKPFAALLVDCPDINLPLARVFKADGIKVLQYMGPKVWAWRKDRLRLLKQRTDMVALGFEFEKKLYDDAGVPATFVGHPLLDAPLVTNTFESIPTRPQIRRTLHVPPKSKVVALLPGSRKSELKYHGELMIETGIRLLKAGVVPVFAPYPGAASDALIDKARSLGCILWQNNVCDLLPGCDAALAASGTVTLEIAMAGVPMAIVYKMDNLSYRLGKRFLKIPCIGLPNWVAGQNVIPELLQSDATAETLVATTHTLLTESETQRQKKVLAGISQSLGTPGAARRVARLLSDWQNELFGQN